MFHLNGEFVVTYHVWLRKGLSNFYKTFKKKKNCSSIFQSLNSKSEDLILYPKEMNGMFSISSI